MSEIENKGATDWKTGFSLDIGPRAGVLTSREASRLNLERNRRSWMFSVSELLDSMPTCMPPSLTRDGNLSVWFGKQLGEVTIEPEVDDRGTIRSTAYERAIASISRTWGISRTHAKKYIHLDHAGEFDNLKRETKKEYWTKMMGKNPKEFLKNEDR